MISYQRMHEQFPVQPRSYSSHVQKTAAKCALYLQRRSQRTTAPQIPQMGLQRHRAWCWLRRTTWGLGLRQGRDSPGCSPRAQCCVGIASGDSVRYKLPWKNICIAMTPPELRSEPSGWTSIRRLPSRGGTLGDLLRNRKAHGSQG